MSTEQTYHVLQQPRRRRRDSCALFISSGALPGHTLVAARGVNAPLSSCPVRAYRRAHRGRGPSMQIPPNPELFEGVPFPKRDQAPPEYRWDPTFPGTLKPGLVEDNFPLDKVLESDVYERMVYDEFDMDERVADIIEPEEDLLEWLAKKGRLIPKDAEDNDFELDAETQIATSGDAEEMDGFADDDSKMIAYYSRQSEGSAEGASLDFGGFSESSDYDAGF